MKKLFYLIKILLVLVISQILPCKGQNLVFNGDISLVDSCNLTISQNIISTAPNFFNPTMATPDLFHFCSTNPSLGVPSNSAGYMNPFIGSGYLGFGMLPFYFEYISYKKGVDIFEESRPYSVCVNLLKSGSVVYIEDTVFLPSDLKQQLLTNFGSMLKFISIDSVTNPVYPVRF